MGGGKPKKVRGKTFLRLRKSKTLYSQDMYIFVAALLLAFVYVATLASGVIGCALAWALDAGAVSGAPFNSAVATDLGWVKFVTVGPFLLLQELIATRPYIAFVTVSFALAACVTASANIYREHKTWLISEKERTE